jgi:uncharacterized protein (DUF1810 family)
MMNLTSHDLNRFTTAQDRVYDGVLDELAMGHKTSHWMWFIFPQLRGLGTSANAKYFGIASKEEAQAYLEHLVLGARLKECVNLLLSQRNSDAHDIFGSPDDLKLRSCLTLFSAVSGDPCFKLALDRFYTGKTDLRTLQLLQ